MTLSPLRFPDGARVVSASQESSQIWNADTREGVPTSVAFSPYGTCLLPGDSSLGSLFDFRMRLRGRCNAGCTPVIRARRHMDLLMLS